MIEGFYVEAYVRQLKSEEAHYQDEIAKCERKLSVLRQRIANPEKWLSKEIKEGSGRARVAMGEKIPERKSNLPKKSSQQSTKDYSEEELKTPLKVEVEEKIGFGFFKK